MSLQVVEKETRVISQTEAHVMLESSSIDELLSLAAKNLAIKAASELGFRVHGISKAVGPLYVDDNDKTINPPGFVVSAEEMLKIATANKDKYRYRYHVMSNILGL